MTEAGRPCTLQAILGSGERLPLDRALALMRATAVALDALHARQLIHGSLSPSSVEVTGEDGVTLLPPDSGEGTDDRSGAAREYWSPQRQAGEPARAADDLYALGLIASALLTGSSDGAVTPSLHHGVQEVLRAQHSWAPAERFSSGGELARELERAAAGCLDSLPLAPDGGGRGARPSSEPAWAAARRVALARRAQSLALAEIPDRGPRERIRTMVHHPMQRPDYPDFPLAGGWVAVLVVVLCSVYLFPLYFMLFPHG